MDKEEKPDKKVSNTDQKHKNPTNVEVNGTTERPLKKKHEISVIQEEESETGDEVRQGSFRQLSKFGRGNDNRESKMSRTSKMSSTSHGYDNVAFDTDSVNLNRGNSQRSSMNASINTVHKEQYCFCSRWSRCQRAAAVTISILVIIIIILIIVIIVISQNEDLGKSLKLT